MYSIWLALSGTLIYVCVNGRTERVEWGVGGSSGFPRLTGSRGREGEMERERKKERGRERGEGRRDERKRELTREGGSGRGKESKREGGEREIESVREVEVVTGEWELYGSLLRRFLMWSSASASVTSRSEELL